MNRSVSNSTQGDGDDDADAEPVTDTEVADGAGTVAPLRRWPKRAARAIVVVVLLPVAVLLGYRQFFLADAADPLVLGERADRTQVDGSILSTESTVDASVLQASRWVTANDSIVGYRVDEVVGGVLDETVAGRTNDVDGAVEIVDGVVTTADFTVDMTGLDSGSSARDAALRRSELSTDEFPTAAFALDDEIVLDVDDRTTVVEAVTAGRLTLRGEIRTVEAEVEARIVGSELEIVGLVPIDFDDFDIPLDPPGVSLENAQVEFSLILRLDS